jgi:hypothetical protein
MSASYACTSVPITKPKFVRAALADEAPVPPSAMAISVTPVTEPPVIDTLLAACVAIVPNPKLVLAVPALFRSDKLLVTVKKSAAVNAASAHAEPVYTFRLLLVVLKYKSPAFKASPSLSTDGSELLDPKYVSSKVSALAAAAAALAAALVSDVEALLADVAAFDADVEAADA